MAQEFDPQVIQDAQTQKETQDLGLATDPAQPSVEQFDPQTIQDAISNDPDRKKGDEKFDAGSSSIYQGIYGGLVLDDYTQYVPDVRRLQNIDLQRAMNQPWHHQAGRAAAQMVGEVVGGTIEGLGSIPEFFITLGEEAQGKASDFDNALIEFGRDLREGIADATPIYRTNPNSTFDVLDSGWWFSHMPSVASSLSMLIPAKAVTSGISLLGKMSGLSKQMSTGARFATKLAAGAATSRNAENFREAYDVYNSVYNESMSALEDEERAQDLRDSQMYNDAQDHYGKENLSNEELSSYIGSRASWRSYKINSANIVFDAIQFAPVLGLSKVGTRTGTYSKKVLEAQGKWAKMSRLEKLGTRLTPGASLFGTQLTEGVEEGVNYIGGEEGRVYGRELLGGPKTNLSDRMRQYLTDGHFYESAAWGVLGGVVHSGAASLMSRGEGLQSDNNKVAVIQQRKILMGSLMQQMQALDSKPMSEEDRARARQNLKDQYLYQMTMIESQAGTVDLLLDEVNTPEFQEMLKSKLGENADVNNEIESIRKTVEQAEELYKFHQGSMFYTNASPEAQKAIETQLFQDDVAIKTGEKTIKDLDKKIDAHAKNLGGFAEDTKKVLHNRGVTEALAVIATAQEKAKVDGNQKEFDRLVDLQRKVEKQRDTNAPTIAEGAPLPTYVKDLYASRVIEQAKIDQAQERKAKAASEENIKKVDEELKQQAKDKRKAAKDSVLNSINNKNEVDDDLRVRAKDSDPDIRTAAKNKLAELDAVDSQAASKKATAAEKARGKKAKVAQSNPFEVKVAEPSDPGQEQVAEEDDRSPLEKFLDETPQQELPGLDESGPSVEGLDEQDSTPEGLDEENPYVGELDNGETSDQDLTEYEVIPGTPFAVKRPVSEDTTVADTSTLSEEDAQEYEDQVKHIKTEISRKRGSLKRAKRPATIQRLNNEIADLENKLKTILEKGKPEPTKELDAKELELQEAKDQLNFEITNWDEMVKNQLVSKEEAVKNKKRIREQYVKEVARINKKYSKQAKSDKSATQTKDSKTKPERSEGVKEIISIYTGGNLFFPIAATGFEVAEVFSANNVTLEEAKAAIPTLAGDIKDWFQRGVDYLEQNPEQAAEQDRPSVEDQTEEEINEASKDDVEVIDLAEKVSNLEVDLYTLGYNLKNLLKFGPDGKIVSSKNLTPEQSATLEALYNLKVGDELYIRPTGNAYNGYGVFTKDGVMIGEMYTVSSATKKYNTALQVQSKTPLDAPNRASVDMQVLTETARVQRAEKMEQIFDQGVEEIVTMVKDTTAGALMIGSKERPASEAVSEESLSKHGIAVGTQIGKAVSDVSGEVVEADSIEESKLYAFVDGVGGTLVPVPLRSMTIAEAGLSDQLESDLAALVQHVLDTNGNALSGTPEYDAIMYRMADYITVGGKGIRVVRQTSRGKTFVNLKIPTRDGEIEIILIDGLGNKNGISNPKVITIKEQGVKQEIDYKNVLNLVSDKLTDINREKLKSSDPEVRDNYIKEASQRFTTNIESFTDANGKKFHLSTVTIGNNYGASIQQDAISHKLKPTLQDQAERVNAVAPPAVRDKVKRNKPKERRVKKGKKTSKNKQGRDAMDDMLGLGLRVNGDNVNDGKREDLDAAEAWWRSTFPEVPFIRVQGLIQNGGELAYGLFANAAVSVSNLALPGTAYHEGFHTAMHLYLTEAERAKIYSEARAELSKLSPEEFKDAMRVARVSGVSNVSALTDLQVEEYVAEKFRAFMITGETEYTPKTRIGRWFKKLKDLVKMFLGNRKHTDRLFRNIKAGKFNYKPTPQMIAHAKTMSANLKALPEMTSREIRESVNIISRLVPGAIQDIQDNAEEYGLKPDDNVSEWVGAVLYDYLQENLVDRGIGNIENIVKVLNNFDDTDLSPGILNRVLHAFKLRYGVDLTTATLNDLNRKNVEQLDALESDQELDNSDVMDGKFERNWDDSFLFHNPKNSISQDVRNTIQTLPKLDKFEGDKLYASKDNFFGIRQFVEFDAVYPYLEANLAGIASVQEMLDRIYEFANSADPTFMGLYKKLTVGEDAANLRSAFFTHFSKQRPTILMSLFEDGVLKMVPVNKNNSEFLIRDRFISQGTAHITENPLTEGQQKARVLDIQRPLRKAEALTNEEFAKRYSSALASMGMKLVEGGVDVLEKAIARELNKNMLNKKDLKTKLGFLAQAYVSNNLQNERKNITDLGRSIRYYKSEAIQNVMQNVEGKNLYGVTQSNHVARFMDLVKDPAKETQARQLLAEMLKDPRIRHSNYMRLMVKYGTVNGNNELVEVQASTEPLMENGLPVINREGLEKLNYALLDGIKTDKDGKRFGDMNEVEYVALSVGAYLRGGQDIKSAGDRGDVITTPALTPSDKGTLYLFESPRWDLPSVRNNFHDGSNANLSTVLISRALHGEMQMIRQQAIRLFGDNVDSPSLTDDMVIEGQPLQTHFDTKDGKVVVNGKVVGNGFQSSLLAGLDMSLLTEDERRTINTLIQPNGIPMGDFGSLIAPVTEIIKKYTVQQEADRIEKLILNAASKSPELRMHINAQPGKTFEEKVRLIALGDKNNIGMALHNMLHNYEMQILFYGTEGEYKNDVDHGKRAASPWTPGIALDSSQFSGVGYRVATMTDIKVVSASYQTMEDRLTEVILEEEHAGKSSTTKTGRPSKAGQEARKKAKEMLKGYRDIESTDAQGYMTIDRFQEIMRARGLGAKYDPLIEKIKSGKKLKPKELKLFIDPVKPFYYNRSYDPKLGRMTSNLIKLSSLPLIPQLTRGTELDKLRLWMENKDTGVKVGPNRVDEVVYQTAHKVGSYEVSTPHSIDGESNVKFDPKSMLDSGIRVLPHEGYTIQLDNPEHLIDAKAKFGSQFAKLIIEGLDPNATYGEFGNQQELFTEYQDTVSELVQIAHDTLMEDIGAIVNEDSSIEFTENSLDKLAGIVQNELGRRDASEVLKQGLELTADGKRFKVPAFFSGASSKVESLFLSLYTQRVVNIKVPGGTAVQASSSLAASKKVPRLSAKLKEDGGIDYFEVMLPAYMKEQMTDRKGNVLPINQIPEEALEMIGYRIPTEGKNSMAPMKVVGFLPAEYGGTILVPDEFIVQMGSDFDIDKLFLQMRNIPKKDAGNQPIELSRQEQLQNKLFDMAHTILRHPSHFKDVVSPQGYEGLKKVANKIGELRGKSTDRLNTLFFSTQNEFRNRNSIGSSMIGIAANFNVFTAVAQNTNMELGVGIPVKHKVTPELKAAYPDQIKANAKIGSEVVIIHKAIGKNGAGQYVNAQGVPIVEEMKQFIAATVDNAKDPIFDKFNGKAYTLPTILTMVSVGIPVETALLFASQPAIVEAATIYDDSRSVFGDGSSSEFKNVKESLIKQILALIPNQKKLTKKDRISYWNNVPDVISKLSEQGVPFTYPAGINDKVLRRSIEVDADSLEGQQKLNYLIQQLYILNTFSEVRRSAMSAQDSVKLYKVDVSSAGPSTSRSHELDFIMKTMDKNPGIFIDDVPAHIAIYPERAKRLEESGELLGRTDEMGNELFEIPNTSAYPILQSYYENVTVRSREMLKHFFMAETPGVLSLMEAAMEQFNNGRWDEKVANKVKRLVNQKALSKVPQLQDLDASIMLGIDRTPANGQAWTEKEIINGEAPVAIVLRHVQTKYPDLANNPFHILNKLVPQFNKQTVERNLGMRLISFENITDPVMDEALTESLEEMLFGNDPLLKMLATQLIQYNFLTKGMAFQRDSFAKLLSVDILESFDIPDQLYIEMNNSQGATADITLDLYASINYRDFAKPFSLKAEERIDEVDGGFVVTQQKARRLGKYVLRTGNNSLQNPEYYDADKSAILYKRVDDGSVPNVDENSVAYIPMQKRGLRGKLVELDGSSAIHPSPGKKQSKITFGETEAVATTEEKVQTLQEAFKAAGIEVQVRTDESLTENANVQTQSGRSIITLNPNKVFGDTVIHEFGHIYVDLLGVDNPLVAQGIQQLKNTQLWKDVSARYPELSGEALAKEVLVTAIGREGSKIFNEQRSQNKWRIWLNKFFRAIGRIFGKEPNAARLLASEMLSGQLQRDFRGTLSSEIQLQKGDEITLPEKLAEKRLQLERLIKQYGSDNLPELAEITKEWNNQSHIENIRLMDGQVKNYLDSLDKYLAKMDKFLSDPENKTDENLNAMFQTLYNYSTALAAFADFTDIPTKSLKGDLKSAVRKLNKRGTRVRQSLNAISDFSKKMFADTLGELSTNPEIQEDFMKMFNPTGMHLFDESGTQLLLDALADTNVTFMALLMKDYKINRAQGEEEAAREIIAWRDLMTEMDNEGVTIESLYRKGTSSPQFIMPTTKKRVKVGNVVQLVDAPNPEWVALSEKQKEFSTRIRETLSKQVEHTNSTMFDHGYIPAVPLNEKNYWEEVKKGMKGMKERFDRFKNKKEGEEGVSEEFTNVIVDSAGNVVQMLHMPYMKMLNQLELPSFKPIPEGATSEEIQAITAENVVIGKERARLQKENIKRHGEAVDKDLRNTMERFIYQAVRHKYRKKIEGKMLLAREQLRQMDIIETPGKVDKLKQIFSSEDSKDAAQNRPTIKGEKSNIFKHYDKWLTMVFYDHFEADENETWKKISDGIRDYSSLVGIGANVFSAINNKTYGEMQIAIEAAAGEFFDGKTWASAKLDYNKNILNIYADRDSLKSDNFIVGLMKRFDILQTQEELSGREYGSTSVMKKIMWAKNAMYAMQHAGEHSMQNQVLLAMLKKQKVLLNGKEVSLEDALELVDGRIEVKEGVTTKDGKPVNNKYLANFKNKVISVNQYLHGIYNKEDAGTLQHYALGRLIIQFRKWARPGWNKRFGSKFGQSSWNEIREKLDEGSYVTGAKFAKELFRGALNMDFNAKLHYQSLSESEKANLRRFGMELIMMSLVGVLAMAAAGAAEEDEDSKALALSAYMLDRSRTELMTYLPIYGWFNEGKKLMNSPVASFRQVESLSKILLHTISYPFLDSEDRLYQGGMYRGENKLEVWIKQMIPLVAIQQRWKFIERQTAYYKLYGF